MIFNFSQFLNEFNQKDIYEIYKIEDKFTVSYEVELESNPEQNKDLVKRQDYLEEELPFELSKKLLDEISKNFNLSEEQLAEIYELNESISWNNGPDSIQEIENFFNDSEILDVSIKKFVLNFYHQNSIKGDEIFDSMMVLLKKNFPNFFKKWGEEITIVKDMSLQFGLEFKPTLYVLGLNKGIEWWNDFYDEYEKQTYWQFKPTTGLHINLGIENNDKWNFMKAFIFINDKSEKPFVFKGIEDRIGNRFCGSLRPVIKDYLFKKAEKLGLSYHITLEDLKRIEPILAKKMYDLQKDTNKHKDYGINFKYLKERNYIEYRQVGGVLDRQTVIDKTKYFAYITYLMYDEEYKKNDYFKKLYKFVRNSITME